MDQPTQERGLGEEILGTIGWEASEPFVGQWRKLVSVTNWEKGRIITQWRHALQEAGAPAAEYSDDAWSRLAGGITAQHVGRLRRVHERFAAVHKNYEGLYWSHFFAALDWDDAEMWLEGAVQSSWSVSQMRRRRWETLSAVHHDIEPEEGEVVPSEPEEDVELDDDPSAHQAPTKTAESIQKVRTAQQDDEDATSSELPDESEAKSRNTLGRSPDNDSDKSEPVKPFANLAELPEDITEAFEAFKLAILRHKLEGWTEVSREDVLGSLDALKELAKS